MVDWKLTTGLASGVALTLLSTFIFVRLFPASQGGIQPRGTGQVPSEAIPCPASASQPCVVEVFPRVDRQTETCEVDIPKPPLVKVGQVIRFDIRPPNNLAAGESIEFRNKRGIRIERNRTTAGGKYYVCTKQSDTRIDCARQSGTAGENDGRVFAYTIFMDWTYVPAPTQTEKIPCFVDPLIVSRD